MRACPGILPATFIPMGKSLLSLVDGLVFDGVSRNPAEHPVHIEEGVVVGLDGPPPDGARIIDAGGCLITPGLIDAHFHAYGVDLDAMKLESLPMSYVAPKGGAAA